MFVAMLRKQLHDTDALRIANNIDGALIAEDAILSSLLDISRLESGTLGKRKRITLHWEHC